MLCLRPIGARPAIVMQPFSTVKLSGRIIPAIAAGLVTLPSAAMAKGMPQLDFTTPLILSQVVWGAIIFVVLYILLSRTGLPMVASVLQERAAKIAKDL